MITAKGYALGASTVVIVGVVLGLALRTTSPKDVAIEPMGFAYAPDSSTIRPAEQLRRNRVWDNSSFQVAFTCSGEPSRVGLYQPVMVKAGAAGEVFILDWGDKKIKEYVQGRYVGSFGLGVGKGPGELFNPTDFEVGKDGRVWVCDAVTGILTRFKASGVLDTTFRLDVIPYRIALTGNHTFVLMHSDVRANLFSHYTEDGKLIHRFGKIVENQENVGIAMDGRIAAVSENEFVYGGYRNGVLAIYDLANPVKPLVYVKTINSRGFPKVLSGEMKGARYSRVDPDAKTVTRSISSVGNEIHVMAGIADDKTKRIFDIYDSRNGAYLKSYSLSTEIADAFVTRSLVLTASDTTIVAWRRLN